MHSTLCKSCSKIEGFLRAWSMLNASSRFASCHFCKVSRMWTSFKMMSWCMELQRIKTKKRMLAVKSRQREKNLTINERKFNSKPVLCANFFDYSVSKEGIAPNPIHVRIRNAKPPSNVKQLKSFLGLASFYGRMIPNFAAKMLSFTGIWKDNVGWEKE